MRKIIRHKWRKTDPHKPYDAVCERCGCKRYWDFGFGHVVYITGGRLKLHTPDCLMPNTINYDGKII